jgi:glycosyltransferase involved in cell wall biosynthesis
MRKSEVKPAVSFIIPCFRSLRTIGFTIESILAQETSTPFEVLVVDSSPTSIKDWIRTHFRSVQVIRSEKRLIPSKARNLGAQTAQADTLAFVDADAVLEPNWLELLLPRISHDPEVSVIGGAIKNANPNSFASKVLHWVEFSEFDQSQNPGFREFISSSNLLVRKSDFEAAGRFDERFEMAEDLLFSTHFPGTVYFDSTTGISHQCRSSWKEVKSHLRALGYWSGRLRAGYPLRGSWLVRYPLLCFLLPVYRSWKILTRVSKSEYTGRLTILAHTPLIFAALVFWSHGFYQGLKGTLKD